MTTPIDAHLLRTLFPNASKSTLAANEFVGNVEDVGYAESLKQFALSAASEIVRQRHGNTKAKVAVICRTCGVSFSVPPSSARVRKFCSLKCAYASPERIAHIKKKERGTRICLECKKEFEVHTGAPEAKCCSRKCNGAMIGRTSLGINRRNQPVLCVVEKQCKICGASFRSQRSSHRIYCSNKCSSADPALHKKRIESLNSSPKENAYSRTKKGWENTGGKHFFVRSSWEANYARYLEWQKQRGDISEWEHEPHTFWFETIKRGTRSYLPDFKVILPSGAVEWHEVKGWMDAKSKTKIHRMQKYYPSEKLVIIDQVRYRALASTVGRIVPGWTTSRNSR